MSCLHHLSPVTRLPLLLLLFSASIPPPSVSSGFREAGVLRGLSSSIACGLVKALTSILCTAQQARQHILSSLLSALALLCSRPCLSVAALKNPTEFHEQRKHLDSDKVNFFFFSNCPLSELGTPGYGSLSVQLWLKQAEFVPET